MSLDIGYFRAWRHKLCPYKKKNSVPEDTILVQSVDLVILVLDDWLSSTQLIFTILKSPSFDVRSSTISPTAILVAIVGLKTI